MTGRTPADASFASAALRAMRPRNVSCANVHDDLTFTRAIALHERDALPGAQEEPPATNRDRFRGPEHRGLEMRGAVVVDLVVFPHALWEELVEGRDDVETEARIGVLVDHDRGRRVTHEDRAESLDDASASDGVGDLGGEIDDLESLAGLDAQRFLHGRIVSNRRR